jgi:multisubunit Na+/H+ antiporter MnhB subunit
MKHGLFVASAIIIGGLFCGMFAMTHPFGEPGKTAMDEYFLNNARTDISARNIVTSLVFDYRSFDTVGKAAILFAAVCAIGALFRESRKKS